MSENIVGTLFDAKFDNHDFILHIRQFQKTLSDEDKIGEKVLRWTDSDQPPMYFVEATEYISLYQSLKNDIDIMVDVPFETISNILQNNISNLLVLLKEEFHIEFWNSENKKSNFLIVRNVKNQLGRAYSLVKKLIEDIDKERQLDIKRYELCQKLWKLEKGMSDIATSLLTFTEGYEKLDQTFNESSQFLQHYFFLSSFDEETSAFSNFVAEYTNKIYPDNWKQQKEDKDKSKPVVDLCLTGFKKSEEALHEICNLCADYRSLEKELLDFAAENGYNPFKTYGIDAFAEKFSKMHQVFLQELDKTQ